jgi:hypothetical protein
MKKRIYETLGLVVQAIALVTVFLAVIHIHDAKADKLDEYAKLSPFGQCDIRAKIFVDGMIMRNRGAPSVKAVINGELENDPWVFESANDALFYVEHANKGWEEMNTILLKQKKMDNDAAPPEWKGKINETPYPDNYLTSVVFGSLIKKCAADYGEGSQI